MCSVCLTHSCYLVSSGVPIQEKSTTAEADWGAAKNGSSASIWYTRSHTLDFWPCWAAAVIRWCFHWGRCADQRHTLHPYREIHLYTGTRQNLFTQTVMCQGSYTDWKILTFLMLFSSHGKFSNNSDITVLLTKIIFKKFWYCSFWLSLPEMEMYQKYVPKEIFV